MTYLNIDDNLLQKDMNPGVTRMNATSTTSSPDLATDNSGSRRKKKRVYLSREQKEMEEKRRFPRLPINSTFFSPFSRFGFVF